MMQALEHPIEVGLNHNLKMVLDGTPDSNRTS